MCEYNGNYAVLLKNGNNCVHVCKIIVQRILLRRETEDMHWLGSVLTTSPFESISYYLLVSDMTYIHWH